MIVFRHFIFVIGLLLWSMATNVLAASSLPSPYDISLTFSCLSVNDGLSSNTVRALLQDRKGFVWIGTSRGLNRYDAHRMVLISGTRSMSVTALAENNDTIWVGTENGLFLYSQRLDSVKRYKCEDKNVLSERLNVASLRMDDRGNLWVATMGQGVLRIDTKNGRCYSVPIPENGKVYGCVYVDKKGGVWAVSNWEKVNIIRYDEKKNCFVPYLLHGRKAGLPENVGGISLMEDAVGKMWLGVWDGALVRFDASSHQAEVMFTPEETRMRNVHSLMELTKDYLIVGSDEGVAVVDVQNHQVKLHNRNTPFTGVLSDNFVYPLMLDREGGTWIGTYYGGVNYTHPVASNFTSYVGQQDNGRLSAEGKLRGSVSGSVINHFCEDRHHRLWIASDDGGLCYYDPTDGSFVKVRLSARGIEHNVHALNLEGDLLYVGTYAQGMDIVDVNTLAVTHVPSFDDENGKHIDATSYAICSDRQHRIWVGTFHEVGIYNPDTRTLSNVKQVGVPVMDIIQDCTDRVWVATDGNGLWSYGKGKTWKHYLDFKGGHQFDGATVSAYSLHEDSLGTLWVGMASGLYRYVKQKDRFEMVTLITDDISVYGITSQGENLWLTTSAGILCYSTTKNEVTQLYQHGGNIVSVDFLPDAILRASDGKIYLGTTNGFITFTPQQMHRSGVKPQVVFTGLDIFNRPVPVDGDILSQRLPYVDELCLSYRESVFRIYFSAMSYWQPSDISYSYYLEGFDTEWIEIGNHQSATYTNLPPGTYILHVRAVTNEGTASEEATLRIVITPPFYWNTPAKIFYLLLIIAAIILLVRHLLRRKEQKHEAEMEQLNIQKEQEIQELNIQKEQEILELNTQREQEVHDARIKFMTINEKDQAFLDKMEVTIEQNFSNPDLSVDFLASELGVSRSGLFAKIKALADVTPNEMIQVIRLKHAASLLVTGNYRVNEVCYMVGFSSPSYFAKCFQKQYGCTPAKYKG